MSYSFSESEWPAYCECKYDEAQDEMDREDCPFHFELEDDASRDRLQIPKPKKQSGAVRVKEPAA